MPWQERGEAFSSVERASVSRTLARLERRGLILRQNTLRGSGAGTGKARHSADEPHNRTTHVRITDAGRLAAEASAAAFFSLDCLRQLFEVGHTGQEVGRSC